MSSNLPLIDLKYRALYAGPTTLESIMRMDAGPTNLESIMRMESHLFGMLIDQLYLQVCSPALLLLLLGAFLLAALTWPAVALIGLKSTHRDYGKLAGTDRLQLQLHMPPVALSRCWHQPGHIACAGLAIDDFTLPWKLLPRRH